MADAVPRAFAIKRDRLPLSGGASSSANTPSIGSWQLLSATSQQASLFWYDTTASDRLDALIIHEYLHFDGVIGDDNTNQTATFANGMTAVGSVGVQDTVDQQCGL